MALSIISVNVNGLRDCDKQAGLVQWLHSLPSPADIVCLQQCHCVSVGEVSFWFAGSGLLCVVSPGSNHSCRCIVLFRPSLSLVRSWSDDHGCFVQCSPTVVRFFVLPVCMRQIATRSARSFLVMSVLLSYLIL